MKNNIFKILEKYDIDEFHWKLEITDEIISAFQTQKPMKDWKAKAEKKDELIVYLKSISISKSPNEEYENKLLTELAALESQEKEISNDVLDLKQCVTNLLYAAYDFEDVTSTEFDKWAEEQIDNIEEYAQSSKVSDEMIEKYANKVEFSIYESFWDTFIAGAKAMRDNLIKPE